MKYPFSPEILDALSEELTELFRGLDLKLLEEMFLGTSGTTVTVARP